MIVPYIANTESDRAEMLKAAGFSSLEDMWEKAGVRFPYPALEGFRRGNPNTRSSGISNILRT
ncbi:MAG: hypothetical protein V8T87_09255 [Victivallales bacterium]